MAVGPSDNIDRLLVNKYLNEKVNNADAAKLIDQKKMLDTMNDYAQMHRNMANLNQKLKSACDALKSKNVYYHQTKPL